MKKIIKSIAEITICGILGLVLTAAIIGSLVLFVAMPDILAWVASYIGELLTYSLYFFAIGAFIYWCLSKK